MLDREISDISREDKLMLSGQDTRTDEPIRMLLGDKCQSWIMHIRSGRCDAWNLRRRGTL